MKEFFSRASGTSYSIGTTLALIHIVASWYVILRIAGKEPDAQWQLVWIFFLPFDLPFSLLVFFAGSIFPDWSFKSVSYPISEFRSFLWPSFIHGIVGPLWYFLLPIFISSLRALQAKAA